VIVPMQTGFHTYGLRSCRCSAEYFPR